MVSGMKNDPGLPRSVCVGSFSALCLKAMLLLRKALTSESAANNAVSCIQFCGVAGKTEWHIPNSPTRYVSWLITLDASQQHTVY